MDAGQTSAAASRAQVAAAAERGDPAAQLLLAEALASEGAGEQAVVWLARSARTGHAASFALFGVWQLLGYNLPRKVSEGLQRLEIAARHGEAAAAAFLSGAFANGLAGGTDWPRALDWLVEAARLGSARALAQVALLQADGAERPHRCRLLKAAADAGLEAMRELAITTEATPESGVPPWDALRAGIDVEALVAAVPPATRAVAEPRIDTCEGLAGADLCRYVMAVAERGLRRATVNVPRGGEAQHEMRTNSSFTIGPTHGDVLLQVINERVARFAGLPLSHQEATNVLRYRPGEVYDDHFDWFNPASEEFQREIEHGGQRTATVLVYLSGDFEGGETEFPELGWRFRGGQGDAVGWRNAREDGSPEPRTLHAGRPPTTGEKWVLSKWIRSKPQPLFIPPSAQR